MLKKPFLWLTFTQIYLQLNLEQFWQFTGLALFTHLPHFHWPEKYKHAVYSVPVFCFISKALNFVIWDFLVACRLLKGPKTGLQKQNFDVIDHCYKKIFTPSYSEVHTILNAFLKKEIDTWSLSSLHIISSCKAIFSHIFYSVMQLQEEVNNSKLPLWLHTCYWGCSCGLPPC